MNKVIYKFVSNICLLFSIIYIFLTNPFKDSCITINNMFLLLIVFILIHIFKCLRQYLLLIEFNVNFIDFFSAYVKGTFISIVFPFKMGEFYKAFQYGYLIKDYVKGLITIIVDKFFDAIILLTLIIPYEIIKHNTLSVLSGILLIFVTIVLIVFVSFNTTYYYLNKHFIIKKDDSRSIIILNVLDYCNSMYLNVKNMIKNRISLIGIFAVISWALEYVFVLLLNGVSFSGYVNAIFFANNDIVLSNYTIIAISCFIFIQLMLIRKRGNKR